MMSGFVIDTAGVFCAVISDQHSDLYIDKDDLMPELVSDDDTDSEDETPPYRRMNEELSILPAILHAFDPIQLFYEAVSAELDRCPSPSLCILHTHRSGATLATRNISTCYDSSSLLSKDELAITSRSTSLSTPTCQKIRMRSVGGPIIGD